MPNAFAKHQKLTEQRVRAYEVLFQSAPSSVFPPHVLFNKPDDRILIDILVYTLPTESGEIDVAVTNGMSDQRMVDPGVSVDWYRRELIQYFPKCTEGHAKRLHEMAWLPLYDGFYLDTHHTITWPHPAIPQTPWKNAFFLLPLINSHREFICELEGDPMSFLWHIPISDEELAFKKENGSDALIDCLEAVDLPWVFDEKNRPSLVG